MLSQELERRIQVLEDLEKIKKLKAKYAHVCDVRDGVGYPKELAKLFTENAVWEAEGFGRYEGRAAIEKFFEGSNFFSFTVHYFMQPIIEIDSEKHAHGRWDMWCPATSADGRAIWGSAVEEDKYEKVNGEWLISEIKVTVIFMTPYEEGWNKKRFLD